MVQGLGPRLSRGYERAHARTRLGDDSAGATNGQSHDAAQRVGAFGLQAAFRLLGVVPPARNYFAEMKCSPSRDSMPAFSCAVPIHAAPLPLIGRLFPQPTVRGASRTEPLDEFLGDNFALLSLPQTPPSLFDRLPADVWLLSKLQRVAFRIVDNLRSEWSDQRFRCRGQIFAVDEEHSPGLALIRPDRYVAAYLPAEKYEQGLREVDEIIARTWS